MGHIIPPSDWPIWIDRWERMQERYLAARAERFAIIARLIRATQGQAPLVLDLGCGTGSVMAALLSAIPGASAVGVDLDPTLLALAEKRLAPFGARAQVVRADVRQGGWVGVHSAGKIHAIVSATALHWLSPDRLSFLYAQAAELLRPGGIFLNADHVASEHPGVQQAWVQHRSDVLSAQANPAADDWNGFWRDYLAVLGEEVRKERERYLGAWEGVEDGQPLAWHVHHLRQAGFTAVDCFWRADCDAIYGGFVPER